MSDSVSANLKIFVKNLQCRQHQTWHVIQTTAHVAFFFLIKPTQLRTAAWSSIQRGHLEHLYNRPSYLYLQAAAKVKKCGAKQNKKATKLASFTLRSSTSTRSILPQLNQVRYPLQGYVQNSSSRRLTFKNCCSQLYCGHKLKCELRINWASAWVL